MAPLNTRPARRRSVSTAVGIAAERRTLAALGRGNEVARARTAARQVALASRRDAHK